MFKLRKREDYFNPRTTATRVDLEGIICLSVEVEAKTLQNYNLEELEGEGTGSDTWLE